MAKFSTKIFILLIGLLIFMNIGSGPVVAENAIITKTEPSFVPEVNFFDANSEKVYLEQFEGKTVLLCFWASWCGTCIEELPDLDVLQKDFRKLPFEVVAVSEDFSGVKAVKTHFDKYDIRHLKIYHDYKNALFRAMSVVGLPTAFLIDPEGRIKAVFKGNVKWHDDSVRRILLSEISGNPETPKNSYLPSSLNKKATLAREKLGDNQSQRPAGTPKPNLQDQGQELKGAPSIDPSSIKTKKGNEHENND